MSHEAYMSSPFTYNYLTVIALPNLQRAGSATLAILCLEGRESLILTSSSNTYYNEQTQKIPIFMDYIV